VEILEGVASIAIEARDGAVQGVQLSSGEYLRCEKLVNCAGAWSPSVGALAGVPVPLQAVEHMYIVTEPVAQLANPFPVLRDLESGIYLKEDAGKLVLGGFEPDAKVWNPQGEDGARPYLEFPEDWDQFEPFMTAGLARMPMLGEVGVQRFMNGPEAFTPDSRPLVGESPYLRNFFVAAGMNSTGMMSSAGIGKAMAQLLSGGVAAMDLWEIDIARFEYRHSAPAYLAQRMREAVADVFAMHWPLKQPGAGGDVRRSPLHEAWQSAGAVFGAPATGWERPLWYATQDHERRWCSCNSFARINWTCQRARWCTDSF
jgi:4-methylaminobutanoate oxidase (formaldehyde-forming)